MTILAVIPARLAAVRLPRKPLRLLGGVPLVVRVWERVAEMGVADEVVVATDAEDIAAVLRKAGARVAITSPEHQSGTSRVAEVAKMQEFKSFDVMCNVQGDEPFLPAEAVAGAIEQVSREGHPLGTAAMFADANILGTPSVVKVVCTDDGRALYFSRAGIPHLRDTADHLTRDQVIRQHLGVYAYTRESLAAWVALPPHRLEITEGLEQLRPLAAGMAIGVTTIETRPPMGGIDTESDLAQANALWTVFIAGMA
jgi:3-deoxy-manno-octulosonate cytidylyltransferase (CMP-KDO synthetase)